MILYVVECRLVADLDVGLRDVEDIDDMIQMCVDLGTVDG